MNEQTRNIWSTAFAAAFVAEYQKNSADTCGAGDRAELIADEAVSQYERLKSLAVSSRRSRSRT